MECQFCKKVLSSTSSLNYHQKNTKSCLKIQGKEVSNKKIQCEFCKKVLSSKSSYKRHIDICSYKYRGLEDQLYDKDKEIEMLKNTIKELREDKKQIQASYENIATTSILNDKDKIVKLTKKYVRKRPRQQFDERNVVYIITTPSLKKERRYILGKATNLTNRLSTYNKTDEHEVVFYKSCNSKEMMSCIENMIFNKLSRYREQANRERFILPENQEISLFYNTIEECINFFS